MIAQFVDLKNRKKALNKIDIVPVGWQGTFPNLSFGIAYHAICMLRTVAYDFQKLRPVYVFSDSLVSSERLTQQYYRQEPLLYFFFSKKTSI